MNIVSSNTLLCPRKNGNFVLLDSVQYQRRRYTSVTCGDRLNLYRMSSTALQLVDYKSKYDLWLTYLLEQCYHCLSF